MSDANTNEELWRSLLSGTNSKLRSGRRLFGRLPAPKTPTARCKLCLVPFDGPLAPIVRLIWRRVRWARSPLYCNVCEGVLKGYPGGVELEAAVLFADVRGSTTLATHMSPGEYSRLMQRFYNTALSVLTKHRWFVQDLDGEAVDVLPLIANNVNVGAAPGDAASHPSRHLAAIQQQCRIRRIADMVGFHECAAQPNPKSRRRSAPHGGRGLLTNRSAVWPAQRFPPSSLLPPYRSWQARKAAAASLRVRRPACR